MTRLFMTLPLTGLLLLVVTGRSQAEEVKEFTYKKAKEGELKIHVHYPEGWTKTDKRPAIVFFFGGGWQRGSVEQFATQAKHLAGRGMVAARADYRVKSRHNTTPDKCVEDAKSAVRWLRKNAGDLGIDPERIVASGGSAGGHIAACTAVLDVLDAKDEDLTISSRPNAVVLFNPVLDTGMLGSRLTNAEGEDISKLVSPIAYLKKGAPPAIVFFGTSDRLLEGARGYITKSRELGNRTELHTAADQPHGFFNKSPWTELTLKQADEFLVSLGYLKGEPTVAIPAGTKEVLKNEK